MKIQFEAGVAAVDVDDELCIMEPGNKLVLATSMWHVGSGASSQCFIKLIYHTTAWESVVASRWKVAQAALSRRDDSFTYDCVP